jgi:hypothetical protein
MTTKVHVVNFGPDVVEAETTNVKQKLYPHQYADFYVYDGAEVTVREVKTQQTGETK